jgi:hypothetical protein
MKYSDILKQAKSLKASVEKDQKFNINSKYIYYICKAIIKQADVKHIDFDKAPKPSGQYVSRTVYKSDYMAMVKHLIEFVEKKGRLPNFIKTGDKNVRVRDYGYAFARILVYINDKGIYPKYVNINSKAYTKSTEYPNKVYGLWVKYIGTKPKYLDDVCDYIMKHFTYQFYYDDQKSNEEVLKTKAGNCTDLLQLLTNMADAMDYDWRVIHTQCRQSGVGHVYGQFKKKGTTNWFTRDIACIADESRYCVWCEVPNGGNLLAKNPSWFLSNRQR